MQTALIVDGAIHEILQPLEGFTLAECFPEGVLSACVAAPDEARIGWTTADGGRTFAPPPTPVAPDRPRTATTYQLMSALTDAQWTAYPGAKAKDQRLFSARDTPWPESNAKVARIAAVMGIEPSAWFDAALAVG